MYVRWTVTSWCPEKINELRNHRRQGLFSWCAGRFVISEWRKLKARRYGNTRGVVLLMRRKYRKGGYSRPSLTALRKQWEVGRERRRREKISGYVKLRVWFKPGRSLIDSCLFASDQLSTWNPMLSLHTRTYVYLLLVTPYIISWFITCRIFWQFFVVRNETRWAVRLSPLPAYL